MNCSGVSDNTKITVTATAHGFSTGNVVIIVASGGPAENTWLITVVDADTFTLDDSGSLGIFAFIGTVTLYDGTSGIITDATNAEPIVITTSLAHGRSTNQIVTIAAVGGNTAANGTWSITVLSDTTFSLTNSNGNAAYTSGGTWALSTITSDNFFHTRIRENSTMTGTGAITVTGAVAGFCPFSLLDDGDMVEYEIDAVDGGGVSTGVYEHGIGFYSKTANTVSREALASASTWNGTNDAGGLVDFGAGAKLIHAFPSDMTFVQAGEQGGGTGRFSGGASVVRVSQMWTTQAWQGNYYSAPNGVFTSLIRNTQPMGNVLAPIPSFMHAQNTLIGFPGQTGPLPIINGMIGKRCVAVGGAAALQQTAILPPPPRGGISSMIGSNVGGQAQLITTAICVIASTLPPISQGSGSFGQDDTGRRVQVILSMQNNGNSAVTLDEQRIGSSSILYVCGTAETGSTVPIIGTTGAKVSLWGNASSSPLSFAWRQYTVQGIAPLSLNNASPIPFSYDANKLPSQLTTSAFIPADIFLYIPTGGGNGVPVAFYLNWYSRSRRHNGNTPATRVGHDLTISDGVVCLNSLRASDQDGFVNQTSVNLSDPRRYLYLGTVCGEENGIATCIPGRRLIWNHWNRLTYFDQFFDTNQQWRMSSFAEYGEFERMDYVRADGWRHLFLDPSDDRAVGFVSPRCSMRVTGFGVFQIRIVRQNNSILKVGSGIDATTYLTGNDAEDVSIEGAFVPEDAPIFPGVNQYQVQVGINDSTTETELQSYTSRARWGFVGDLKDYTFLSPVDPSIIAGIDPPLPNPDDLAVNPSPLVRTAGPAIFSVLGEC